MQARHRCRRGRWRGTVVGAVSCGVLLSGCGEIHGSATVRPSPPGHGAVAEGPLGALGGSGVAPPPLRDHDATLSGRRLPQSQEPLRLLVPDIGVDHEVVDVGLAADGQMDVPDDADSVAWYGSGPAPGDAGAAVLAGHVDFGGRRGVFWRLDELQEGHRITVTVEAQEREFRVVSTQRYDKDDLPVRDVFRTTGAPRLVLITCGGSFDRAHRSYRDNVVVTAVPLGDGS